MNPLRNRILELLKQNVPNPLRLNELSKLLQIKSNTNEYQKLRTVLQTMVEEGSIQRSTRRRYSLAGGNETTFEGVLSVHNMNGVVTTNSPHFPKIQIKRQYLLTALHSDTVTVKLLAFDRENKPNGEITKINKRAHNNIIGRVDYDGDFYFLIPDDDRIHVDILLHPKRLNGADDGDKVEVELIRWNDPFKSPEGEVVEIIGKAGIPQVEYESIAREFHLSKEFPKGVVTEAKRLAKKGMSTRLKDRLDLRDTDIITIDPADARDFDDALSLTILENGNYQLGVHIADVGHFVPEGTKIDNEALERGTSVYLVDGVIPMLPEVLSNDVCSLLPHTDRMAFSVLMEFTKRGVPKGYEIRKSIINSSHRFTYKEAQDIIDGADHTHRELVLNLQTLARALRARRYKKGGIDFETTEVKFQLDENKAPTHAELKRRTEATSLVEDCMLAANRAVAEHIAAISPKVGRRKKLLPFLYRIHDYPDAEKLAQALDMIRAFGVEITNGRPSSKEINTILGQVSHLPEKDAINMVLLRAMAKAEYADFNVGHYGLGFESYTHFTSPIRRYPDLIIHRLLHEYAKAIPDEQRLAYLYSKLDEISDHCSARERLAVEAERASVKLTQVALASENIGIEFNGTVTGITNFGMFVMIDGLYAEGLLRLRDLEDDYYWFDELRYSLIGKRKRRVFRIGTRLRVKIVRVNLEKRELDFSFIGDERDSEAQIEELPEVSESTLSAAREMVERIERKQRSRAKKSTAEDAKTVAATKRKAKRKTKSKRKKTKK